MLCEWNNSLGTSACKGTEILIEPIGRATYPASVMFQTSRSYLLVYGIGGKRVSTAVVGTKKARSERKHFEDIIDDGLKSLTHIGTSLKAIKDGELWAGDYESWEDYCFKRFKFTSRRGEQLIEAGAFLDGDFRTIVQKHSEFLPSNEGQARALLKSADDDAGRAKVWLEAQKRAEEAGKEPTAKLINTVADEIVGPKNGKAKAQKAVKTEIEKPPETEATESQPVSSVCEQSSDGEPRHESAIAKLKAIFDESKPLLNSRPFATWVIEQQHIAVIHAGCSCWLDWIDAREEKPTKKFVKPTVDQVRDYCRVNQIGIDAAQFVDFYESKGWMVGKNAMKDWKAATRTWSRNDHGTKPSNGRLQGEAVTSDHNADAIERAMANQRRVGEETA